MSNARRWQCDLKTYHADKTAVSHSGLDLVLDDPAEFYHERIADNERESKPWFEEGQSLEDALLGGDGPIGSNLVVIPEDVLDARGARSGAKWKKFEAANKGKMLLKADDDIVQMVQAVLRHDAARELFEAEGTKQETIVWHNDKHGVDVRARFDFIHIGAEVVVDLKSTRTAATLQDCSNESAKWGYHRQAALYSDAVEEFYGIRPHFIFVFVSKKAPAYRVQTFELTEDFLEIGAQQNDEALATYAECRRTGLWLPKEHGRIKTVPPPNYLRFWKSWRA
jgi:hypothetical protein